MEPDSIVAQGYEVFRERRKPTEMLQTSDPAERERWESPLQSLDPSDVSYEEDLEGREEMLSFASNEALLYLMPGFCRICEEEPRYLSWFLPLVKRLAPDFTTVERAYMSGFLRHVRWVVATGDKFQYELRELDALMETLTSTDS